MASRVKKTAIAKAIGKEAVKTTRPKKPVKQANKTLGTKPLINDIQKPRKQKVIMPLAEEPMPISEPFLVRARVAFTKQLRSHRGRRLTKAMRSPRFGYAYMGVAVLVLLGTTLLWAWLGAKLQASNADQLVNAYLFNDVHTLQQATFPGQHTFLLKWPLFYLIKLYAFSPASYLVVTIATVMTTVALLAGILYRIDKRPLMFGTLCLALASVLLLIPTQPYAGGILPVNMAMVTTRNLEYIVFIVSLSLLVRRSRMRSLSALSGIVLLTLLVASDKLFLTVSIGGALLAMITYAVALRYKLVSLSVNWLLAGVIAAAAALGLIGLLVGHHITTVASVVGAGPYGLVSSVKDAILGLIYLVAGLLTNFGANPAFDAVALAQFPVKLTHRLISVSGPSFIVNFLILIAGLIACYKLLAASLWQRKPSVKLTTAYKLSLMLIWSSIAAGGLFVASKHYYAVDARYMGIALFAVFIAMANYARRLRWQPVTLVLLGIVFSASCIGASYGAITNYHDQEQALSTINQRNGLVAQALANHKVGTLLGDYWRVLPIKAAAGGSLPITPLQGCTQPRDILTSKTWQQNLRRHSFAYLLTLDASLTDYPHCSLQQITTAYGRPNISTLIAGTVSSPKEIVLFYDRGIHLNPSHGSRLSDTSTILPVSLDSITGTTCIVPTVVNIVAHQDDDLLFQSPDLYHSIVSGDCVRTIYMTAGDGGNSAPYWQSRERGSEAAYNSMLGKNDIWIQRIVKLTDKQFITIASPRSNPKISLLFMRLPDGNLKGDGFKSSDHESLQRLKSGSIRAVHSIDDQSMYTAKDVTKALVLLLHTYQPAEIRSQSNYNGTIFPDHSDHRTVGLFTKEAYAQYETEQYKNQVIVPLKLYEGYPIHELSSNITDDDLAAKEAAFIAYSKFDGSVCGSLYECNHTATYGSYLSRQYKYDY